MATTNSSVNLDLSKRLDITCRKGDTFFLTLNITDENGAAIDLTSYSFEMEVRDVSDSVIVSNSDVTFDKNAESTTGRLDITISSSVINFSGTYIYDLESTLSGNVKTWMHGVFKVNKDTTA